MDYDKIQQEVLERTEGVDHTEWSDADKVRLAALTFAKCQRDPFAGFMAFMDWNTSGNSDVQDFLLDLADRMEAE